MKGNITKNIYMRFVPVGLTRNSGKKGAPSTPAGLIFETETVGSWFIYDTEVQFMLIRL